jgi:D-threonate/D-erythronate kinase
MQVRIVTDDFTSSTDGAVAFACLHGGARVALGVAQAVADAGRHATLPGAWSVDTDSRHCAADEAARRVALCARAWGNADVLIKQFDSTLRGPLAAECVAAWQASGRARLLIVPAFPAAGRTTQGGRVLVDGVEVHRAAFARDPLSPVAESSVPNLFAALDVQLAVAPNADGARSMFDQGLRSLVVDVRDEAELALLARRFCADRNILWAGSTGIARALAQALSASGNDLANPPARIQACASPWVLIGSLHPASREQGAVLQRERPSVKVLATAEEPQDPHAASAALAAEARQAIADGRCDGVVATGGETAKALAQALQARSMEVVKEVEPGVALSVLDFPSGCLPIVTKAGGFGHACTLVACVDELTGGAA